MSVDWNGFQGYMAELDNVRQNNVIKLVHNWINNGQQQDLFSNQQHFTQYPAECCQIETHMSCYAPPILTQNNKCVVKLITTWGELMIAAPIARALKCIVTCVISKTEPLQRRLSASTIPFDIKLFQAWPEQLIGWQQLFKDRISRKWAEAQCIYCTNPDTKNIVSFSPYIWASKTIQILIYIWLWTFGE